MLLFMLVVVTALGPMAMQIFIPALPAIADGFAVTAGTAQLAFSLSTLAIAVGTLFYGPLSDRRGRRPVLLSGLVVYMAGSLLCLIAADITVLIVGRIVQAIGGSAGMVLARAMVQDLYGRERAATVLAYLTMAMVVAPMAAPVIGGLMIDLAGWRAIFLIGAVIGGLAWAGTHLAVRETHPRTGARTSIGTMAATYIRLLGNRAFCGYAFQGAFAISLFYSFLAGAPFITIEIMGLPASVYGFWSISISACFMAGNFTAARLSISIGIDRMILSGAGLAVLGVALSVLLAIFLPLGPALLFLPMAGVAFAQGLSIPNALASAVAAAPQTAGAASGLAAFLQMGMASVVVQIVGIAQNGTPYPTLMAMIACSLCSLAAILYVRRFGRLEDAVAA